jgi:hypothetical protein
MHSRERIASVMTRLQPRSSREIHSGGKKFFPLQNNETGPWAHPPSYSMCNKGSLHRDKATKA